MTFLLHLADRVVNRPLMITADKLQTIAAVLGGRIGIDATGLAPDASQFAGAAPTNGRPYRQTDDGIGIVTVLGSLVNRSSFIGAPSGLTSYEAIKYQLAAAAADTSTKAIILDLASPGGEAVGAFEAADAVRQAATTKPVIAVVNGMAASAGYALAAGATKIVTTQTGISGSIGVVLLHADVSQAMRTAGITPTFIFAGAHKVDGNPFQSLPASVRKDLQAEVDAIHALFVSTVAAGRKNLSPAAIRATEARAYMGEDAVKAGLVDEVGTFESVLASLRGQRSTARAAPPRAAAPAAVPRAAALPAPSPALTVAIPLPAAVARATPIEGLPPMLTEELIATGPHAWSPRVTRAELDQRQADFAAGQAIAERTKTGRPMVELPAASAPHVSPRIGTMSDFEKDKSIAERFRGAH